MGSKDNVIIYTTETCYFCKQAKEYLAKNGIEFVENNVTSDIDKRTEMIDKTGQFGVPVVIYGDKILIGFDRMEFDKVFKNGK